MTTSQGSDMKPLRKVLGNKAAIRRLEATRMLDNAVICARQRSDLFAQSVYKADQDLAAALQNQSSFDACFQMELVDTLKFIQNNAGSLALIVKKKQAKSASKVARMIELAFFGLELHANTAPKRIYWSLQY